VIEALVLTHKHQYTTYEVPVMLPFKELGSTPGGLTEPPEDKLDGELPG